MKLKFKKLFIIILMIIFLSPKISSAQEKIYDYRKEEQISSGTSHVYIERFTTEGWLDIHVLKLKTGDNFNKITPVFSTEGLSQKSTLSEMMKDTKTVAAINGDFFESQKFPMALGSLYGNEKLYLSSPNIEFLRNSFALRPDFTGYVGHVDNKITISNETSGKTYEAVAYNKMSKPYTGIQILDSSWGKTSVGKNIGEKTVEVLIADGIAIEKRIGGEPFEIGENNYVLVQVGESLNDINIGDKLNLSISGYENKIFSLGGGNILVKDGVIPEDQKFSKVKAPRSGIGVNKDGGEILLVTVDGRSDRSVGMSEKDFAEFMKSIGCHQALNLDGGGSTTMNIFYSGDENVTTVNNPSEGKERKIATAVGISNESPVGDLSYITLSFDRDEIFLGESVNLKLKGYDQYHNRINLDPALINFTVGNELIENESFYPQTEGILEINASYGNLKTSKNLTVHSDVRELKLDTKGLQISLGESYKFENVIGINKNGFRKVLKPEELKFEVLGDIGSFKDNTFIASSELSVGAINIFYKDIVKSIPVSVGTTLTDVFDFKNLDNIELKNSTDDSAKMTSKVEILQDLNDKNSAKISFALNPTTEKESITLQFKEPINLFESKFLGLSIKSSADFGKLTATIEDENKVLKKINIADTLDFKEMKYIEAAIPKGMSGNIYLKNLNLELKNSEVQTLGDLQIQDIKSGVKIPYDFSFVFESSKIFYSDNYAPENYNTKISVLADNENSNLNSNAVIFLSDLSEEILSSFNTEKKIKTDKYKIETYRDFLICNLDTNKSGIREKNSAQWKNFIDSFNSTEYKNIIVISKNDPDNFKDKRETKLLYEVLRNSVENGKNIFLVCKGDEDSAEMRNTFKKITLKNKILNIYESGGVSFELSNID